MRMVALGMVMAALTATPAPAQLPDIGLQVLNLLHTQRTYRANVVLNNNRPIALAAVFIECTFFGEDRRPVQTAKGLISNIRPYERVHGDVTIIDDIPVSTVTCRIGNVSRR